MHAKNGVNSRLHTLEGRSGRRNVSGNIIGICGVATLNRPYKEIFMQGTEVSRALGAEIRVR